MLDENGAIGRKLQVTTNRAVSKFTNTLASMKYLHALIAIILLTGCGTVSEHQSIAQSQNELQTASIGSTLLHVSKQGDLPNVFGGADIYGRKVDKGFTDVKLKGIRDGSVIELLVFDVNRESAENTLDRSLQNQNVSQTVNVDRNGEGVGIPVAINTKVEKEYVISGIKITFVEVRPSSVVYKIMDMKTVKDE